MSPDLAHYQLLRRLRQQLRHHNGSGLIYLFCDQSLAREWLAQELDSHLRARSLRLRTVKVQEIGDVSAAALGSALVDPWGAGLAATWLVLGESGTKDDVLRDYVLARLNESRATLVTQHAFIFLLLPLHYEGRAAEIAPDLWSIRSASYVVPRWQVEEAASLPASAERGAAFSTNHQAIEFNEELFRALQRWQHQWQRWEHDRSHTLSPLLAWWLVDQCLAAGEIEQAQAVAAQVLALSRDQLQAQETPLALHELSLSLERVGDCHRAADDEASAQLCFQRALAVLQQALAASPHNVQGQQDLVRLQSRINASQAVATQQPPPA